MIISPKITAALIKSHAGETAISLDGKVIATGKDSVKALENARKTMPDIEKKDFLISKIFPTTVVA